MNYENIITQRIGEHQQVIETIKNITAEIAKAANLCRTGLLAGKKILFCGNGGSAADSQHLAAEFVGRFQLERAGMPAIALTTDTSILTAVGNDYGFETVFARQVQALGQAGDMLFALSTSGNSENVYRAARQAKKQGLSVIGLTGQDGGKIKDACDLCLNIPFNKAARVQEAHILIGHIICELVDET